MEEVNFITFYFKLDATLDSLKERNSANPYTICSCPRDSVHMKNVLVSKQPDFFCSVSWAGISNECQVLLAPWQ